MEIIKNQLEDFINLLKNSIIKKMKCTPFFAIIVSFFLVEILYPKNCEFLIEKNQDAFWLKGDWNFFRGGGSIASNPDLDLSTWKNIPVPFQWHSVAELKNYKGEIWIRCKLIFNFVPSEAYLDLGFLKEIDEVYWNGEKIGGMGNFEARIPDFSERRWYSIPLHKISEINTLAIRIYGSFWNAGVPDIPKIHFTSNFIKQKLKFESLAYAFSLSYIFSSFLFIFFGIFTPEKKINFYFSIFVILLSLYYSILWGKRYDFFEHYIISYIFELLCLIPLPYFFYLFIKEWLGLKQNDKIFLISTMLLIASAIVGYFVPYTFRTAYLHIVTYVNLLNLFIILIFIFRILIVNKNKEPYLYFGIISLVPFIVNDALITLEMIHTPRLFIFSFSIFMISYGIHLSVKALRLKQESEEKAIELRNLEKQKLNVIYNISNEFQSIFEELKEFLILKKNYESSISKLEFLIENIKALENLENKRYILQPAKIILQEEIHSIVERTLKATKQKKSRVKINSLNPQSFFWTDPYLFKLILYNLIENALLYSTSTVEISINNENESLIIKIKDEGIGISKELENTIFLKYIRGTQKIPGSGIGLTLVKEGVSLLSGQIQFESKPNFFTEFLIVLPPLKEIV